MSDTFSDSINPEHLMTCRVEQGNFSQTYYFSFQNNKIWSQCASKMKIWKARSAGDKCFTLYIIVQWVMSSSTPQSQRHVFNHSPTRALFSRAEQCSCCCVTDQPLSKYSICHSRLKAKFSWLSSLGSFCLPPHFHSPMAHWVFVVLFSYYINMFRYGMSSALGV